MSCAIFFPPCGIVSTTTHRCMLLGGVSQEVHPADYSWGISTKLTRAYYTESRGFNHEFGILSFRGSTMSSVHYIPGALSTALGVPSFGGHNGCIPMRQSQARSSGNRAMGFVP
jgi:hypothetical protein